MEKDQTYLQELSRHGCFTTSLRTKSKKLDLTFLYCNSSNFLISDIDSHLPPDKSQIIEFKVLNIGSGDCTYLYEEDTCLLNFQYFVRPLLFQYYYGITYCPNYTTTVNIMDMYTSIFTLS
jgi:hypothetical protein